MAPSPVFHIWIIIESVHWIWFDSNDEFESSHWLTFLPNVILVGGWENNMWRFFLS